MKTSGFTKRDIIRAQLDLLEHFDDDINVDIREDFCIHLTSTRVPSLDFVVMLTGFTEGSVGLTNYTIGTSKVPPPGLMEINASGSQWTIVSGDQLSERVYQWRTTQELAKRKQLEAKSGKTRTA